MELVRVFDLEPDLVADLDAHLAARLRRHVVVRAIDADRGVWAPERTFGATAPRGWLGVLVLDGLLTRSLKVSRHGCPALAGAGDLLRPWPEESGGAEVVWRVLSPARLALLDDRFAAIAGRFPPVLARLLQRCATQAHDLAFHQALAGVRSADARMHLLLSHLAERWGRVTVDGVVLSLPLTHDLLGRLAYMRRPTATAALGRLVRAGLVARREDGAWVLPAAATVPEEPAARLAA